MSDILLEVDDELRAQQLKAFWTRYGQRLIGLAILAVIATGMGSYWHHRQNEHLQAETSRLISLLQKGEGKSVDMSALQKLAADGTSPLKYVAGLQLARYHEEAGDLQAAQKTYHSIANEKRAASVVRELAAFHVLRIGLALHEDLDSLLKKLVPLTEKGKAFRSSALELRGIILQQQGKTQEANKVFQQLADDAASPNSIRQRASAMIDYGTVHAQ